MREIPSWAHVATHGVFPEASHDDVARFDFLANLNATLSGKLMPSVRSAYETRVKPVFEQQHGRTIDSRQDVRRAIAGDSTYQTWSALRRNSMEMRQQTGRALVLDQLEALLEKADRYNRDAAGLQLDPTIEQPRYASAVDIHCMPGGYHTELVPGDISAGANYDCGIFATVGGMLGALNDGGGQALARWLQENHPALRPRRILDLGCTVGHNAVPLAQAFPQAQVIAIDTGAPVLRYAHARARSLGVENIVFRQANAEKLDYPDNHFDLITSAMFFHESSSQAMPRKLREIYRMLAPGGITVHLEQPQYTPDMDPYEQFMRDWDSYNNNEPFWSVMHDYDLRSMLSVAGFDPADYFETSMRAAVDTRVFPEAGNAAQEDFGRTPLWTAFGARKPA